MGWSVDIAWFSKLAIELSVLLLLMKRELHGSSPAAATLLAIFEKPSMAQQRVFVSLENEIFISQLC